MVKLYGLSSFFRVWTTFEETVSLCRNKPRVASCMRCKRITNKSLSLKKKGRCPSWVPKLISMSLWMSTGWRRRITPDALRIQSAFLWPTFPVNGLTDSHTPRFVVPICLSNRTCEPESVIYFFYSPCFRNATITNGNKSAAELTSYVFKQCQQASWYSAVNGEYGRSRWPDRCQLE